MPTTILVAEDDPLGALLARQVLAGAGWAVEMAYDGVIAIEALQAQPHAYALLLLDLVMPRADAIAVVDAARGLRTDLPIVITSGYPESYVRERLDGRTVDGFVAKPWHIPQLLDTLRRALGEAT